MRTALERIERHQVVLLARDGGGIIEEAADAVVLVLHPSANLALADELAACARST